MENKTRNNKSTEKENTTDKSWNVRDAQNPVKNPWKTKMRKGFKSFWRIIKISFVTLCVLVSITLAVVGVVHIEQMLYQNYINQPENWSDDPYMLYSKQLELEYWGCKHNIVESITEYFNEVSPNINLSPIVLFNMCDEYDVDVRFVIAQGIQESHLGTVGMARKTNSVWNVFAYDDSDYSKITSKGKYIHPNKSIKPYLELLTTRYLVARDEKQLMTNFVDVNGKRYASYPGYEVEVTAIFNKISQTTQLDSLIERYRCIKLEMGR